MTEQGPAGGSATQQSLRKIATSMTGDVAVLTLANDKVNSLDGEALAEIRSFVERCESDPDVAALVVTGRGSVFSAGLDVREVLGNDPRYSGTLLDALEGAIVELLRFPKPTVAAVNGAAIAGGCLLACACDVRIIADSARIGVTELQVGVAFPVLTVELLRHVCGAHAERLMFDARLFTADEACATGLAHRQAPGAELMAAALSQAEGLVTHDPRAYALAKETSRRALLTASTSDDAHRLDRAVRLQWQSEETRTRLGRLLEKRS